jgi:DNA ligase (NAD+)
MANEFHYPIDGIVAKYDDIKYYQSLGATDHHFKGGFAYKFYDEEYETTLKYIDYDVSRTGILTPVAVFDPVDTGDSIIERASLHNISIMEEVLGKNPYVGQKLVVCKQNMIIPQVVRAEQKTYEELEKENVLFITFKNTVCPICGHSTKIATSDSGVKTLYCSNDNCPGKLAQQIDHYCSKKGLDIKGISRATIEKLIDWGWINSISDIYKLHSHQMEWMDQPGFGKASVFKILDAIDNSKENTELIHFISGLGIPLVGGTIAKIICNYYDTWDDFRAAVGGDWTVFEGIGPEISKAINSFDFTEADKIANIVNFIYSDKNIISNDNNNISNKIFCVTGKLKTFRNRDEIKKDIESLGGKVTDSISAKTNYLINNDIESTSSKNKKAKELGIPIISEEEYIKLRS